MHLLSRLDTSYKDNEQTSFRNMEKHFPSAPLDPILQQKFVQLRKEMNEHLDGETHINFNGEKLTRRRIMDVFVYGGLSHANEEKRRLWKTWMNSPVRRSDVWERVSGRSTWHLHRDNDD